MGYQGNKGNLPKTDGQQPGNKKTKDTKTNKTRGDEPGTKRNNATVNNTDKNSGTRDTETDTLGNP